MVEPLKAAGPALEDSSLALPAERSLRSTAEVYSNDRSSLRVQQQVQLTLARRARRTASNGSIHLQKSSAKSLDATDGLLPHMKVNGSGFTNRSLPSNKDVRKPSRRVEVSPPPSPSFSRIHVAYNPHRFTTFTHPGPSQSQRMSTMLGHSLGSDLFRRYAASEAHRGLWMNTSMPAQATFRQRSLRRSAGPQPVFADAAFQQSGNAGSSWSPVQTLFKSDRRGVQRDVGMLSTLLPNEGLLGTAQDSREGQGLRRINSYAPSVLSMEVDTGKMVEAEQTQAQNTMTLKSGNKPPEMTLERAVNLLSQDDEDTLISAASYIQIQSLKSADAKKMVYYLRGIGKLLQLLHIDNEEVQRAAAGALRNVVYQSSDNKMEVKENDGAAAILSALKSSRDVETSRQLTGLLWNLSSHDLLKERLCREAVSVLTQSVLVPSSGISEGENPKDDLLADAEAFHNATGCLRNLSSAGPDSRKTLRECENLIDSLVYYIRGTIADYKTNDKKRQYNFSGCIFSSDFRVNASLSTTDHSSTENCVCILHNLSYHIEAELPKKYMRDLHESLQNLAPKPKTVAVGCFAYRSARITERLEQQGPLLEEKANPRGSEWLWSAITIRMYLSLMARSVRHYTQEAAIGALQNITAGNGAVTEAIAFTIVQRENGLQHVKKMLQEGENDVKRKAVSLIKNLSRYRELHPEIVKQVLPEVVEMLPNDDTGTDLPTEVTASLCYILVNLSQNDTQHVRDIVNQRALPKIINISSRDNGYGPTRAGQAACVLLHTIWKHSDLHKAYKKCGYRKSDFINARTTKAVNSSRD